MGSSAGPTCINSITRSSAPSIGSNRMRSLRLATTGCTGISITSECTNARRPLFCPWVLTPRRCTASRLLQTPCVTSLFHETDGDEIENGILGCQCCIFPVVSGIPILHLQSTATAARDQIQAGRPDVARRLMFDLENDDDAEAFEAICGSPTATYQQ